MIKRLMVAVPVAIALALSACAPFVSTSGEGAIQIYFGTPTGARALSDPPFAQLPVFSGITIKVSGPGMDPVEFTVGPSQTSFTAMVPGGSNRRVELYAPVDWDATATAYPDNISLMPTLVKAYGATTTLDVVPGQRVTAVLRLEVAETKILLPNANSPQVAFADTLNGTASIPSTFTDGTYPIYLSTSTDFSFDRYGLLYFSTGGDVYRITTLVSDSAMVPLPVTTGEVIDNISMDIKNNRLYFIYYGLYYVDLSNSIQYTVSLPGTYQTDGSPLAVDGAGNLYCLVTLTSNDHYVAKLRIDGTTATLIASVPIADLGLTGLTVNDMEVTNGKLYIIAAEHAISLHHGKVVELRLSDLALLNDIGWCPTTPTSPETQFYGPGRFLAVTPRKLYISDEGYDGGSNIDRVVEVDTDSDTISAVGLLGAASFFANYSC